MAVRIARRIGLIIVSVSACIVALAFVPARSPLLGALDYAQSMTVAERASLASSPMLGSLPREYRRALYKTLTTPEQRAQFWRASVQNFARTHNLSDAQRTTISRVDTLLTPSLFSETPSQEQRQRVDQVIRLVVSQFGQAAAREMLNAAGPDVQSSSALPILERVRYLVRNRRPVFLSQWLQRAVPVLEAAQCNCNLQSECYYSQTCGSYNGQTCDESTWGCGFLYMDPCGSLCFYPA